MRPVEHHEKIYCKLVLSNSSMMEKIWNHATMSISTITSPVQEFKLLYVFYLINLAVHNLHGFKPNDGLDFSLRANTKNKANALSLTYLSREKNWKKVSVSYLATSRANIYAGSFIFDAYSLLGC